MKENFRFMKRRVVKLPQIQFIVKILEIVYLSRI